MKGNHYSLKNNVGEKNHNQLLLFKIHFGNFLVDPNFSTIKLLLSPSLLSIYCGNEGRKEIAMLSPCLSGGMLGPAPLTMGYLHKLFGILLLGKVVGSP